jgi:uncharacterized protein with FMN-binding domain
MKVVMIKRTVLVAVGFAILVGLLITLRTHQKPAPDRPAAIHSTNETTTSSQPASRHTYRSGTVLGEAIGTDYGSVQVRVTVRDGHIATITAVKLPHRDPIDIQLSKPAARSLAKAVIAAQDADVDAVSGATYTSEGYLRSLQSALDRLQ